MEIYISFKKLIAVWRLKTNGKNGAVEIHSLHSLSLFLTK